MPVLTLGAEDCCAAYVHLMFNIHHSDCPRCETRELGIISTAWYRAHSDGAIHVSGTQGLPVWCGWRIKIDC